MPVPNTNKIEIKNPKNPPENDKNVEEKNIKKNIKKFK